MSLKFSVLRPSKKLQPFVRRILITEKEESTTEILPIGPTGFGYFTYSKFPPILHYSNRKIASNNKLYLVNQLDKEQPYFEIQGRLLQIGLELLPTAPYYLFGIEGKELTDDFLIMEERFPDEASRLINLIDSGTNKENIVNALESYLHSRLPGVERIGYLDRALELIYLNSGNVEMQELLLESDISERHFRRQFKKIIGIGPKQYCKIIQFNAVFETIQHGREKEVYDMALEHGYYDHAHFINDFKKLLGQSPQQFLKSDHDFLKNYLGANTSIP